MKIDRRSFLSFVIGGAAGTTLSPLPWKLMDDSSIWSQNWPWTPVPKDGEVHHVHSACTLCPGGCGISVRKVDGRAVKIEGMTGHPLNDGGICLLGLSGLQLLYGSTRVRTPLKKVGGKWKELSWKEAISEVADKLDALRKKDQSHKVAWIAGSDRGTVPQLLSRFLTAYGSPNFIRMPSIQDSYELVMHLMHGVQALPGFDFENADFVLSFGSGILDGWGSPVRMLRANSALRNSGGKLIQIESRLSNTAAKSDEWIAINPGTEAALALGLAHVIIKESLHNRSFVDNYSSGFDDWKRIVLDEYSPGQVSKITGIDKRTIATLAKDFARASKPLTIGGRGQGETPSSLDELMAVHALNLLVGNINKKGGIWEVPESDYIRWPELKMDQVAENGLQQERIDGAGSEKYPFARHLLHRLPEVINSEQESPVQALLVAGANPLYSMPDSKAVKEAFEKIPFVVSFSSYMDETAEHSDIILPNHTFLERYQDVPAPVGSAKSLIGLSKPVVKPQCNTKHIGDVVILMARALGGVLAEAFPWNSYEACLKETLGNKWQPLTQKGFWENPFYSAQVEGTAPDNHPRKFEFSNKAINSKPLFKPLKPEGDRKTYPLVLIPYSLMRLSSGFIGDPPFVIKTVEDTILKGKDIFVEVNSKTARAHGLSEGSSAILTTPKGEVNVKVHLFEGIMPGLVAMPKGLGHTAYDQYLADKGINFNELMGLAEDPYSGFNAAWGIRAKLSKT